MVYETSRRKFLQGMVGGAAAWPAFEGLPPVAGESDWERVRRQFPFTEEKVPMNAANLCPSPFAVARRVTELTRDIDIDCSFNNRAKFDQLRERSRQKVAAQLGVSTDEIALVRNTSEANNIINNGLALRPPDEVLLWDQNHPTNNVAWEVRAARFDLVVKRVATPRHPTSPGELVEVFERALGRHTRVLAITHVSNVSGLALPVAELCRVAHRRGIYVHVDGAQSWGALNVNLRELGCDSYAASTHKWFVGPKEAGVLYVRKDRISQIWPNTVAPGWGKDVEPDVQGALKFESLGQRDDACLAAIAAAADLHERIGSSRIEARVRQLAGRLRSGLAELGAKLVTPEDPRFNAGVCIIEVPLRRRQLLVDRLYQEYGIAGAATGGLRLCPHLYNTMEHIERALKGVKAMRHLIG
ncbi:MAG: aminotransferase class V-fold PLP-dependent enzyme [Acidobacteriota bacterium]